jgi:hypothetical protein
MDGLTAVCLTCGRPYYLDFGHLCSGPRPGWPLIPAVTLPEGTPHPDPYFAERGWMVVGGIWQRPEGGGDGEEAAA